MRLVYLKTRDMLYIVLLASWLKKKRMIIFATQPVIINWPYRVQKKMANSIV
jgi:hypothetical protein